MIISSPIIKPLMKNLSIALFVLCTVNLAPCLGQRSDFTINDSTSVSSYTLYFNSKYYILKDTADYDFYWDFGDGNEGVYPILYHTYKEAGTYTVTFTVTTRSGPVNSESTTKEVEVKGQLEIPNVFTPNGDGVNDLFTVLSNGVDILTLKVYTKAGNLIYQLTSPTIMWDGRTVSGDEVSPGIYYYILEIQSQTSKQNRTGFFYLYR
jgi:gliding motility-associated-like protein